MIRTSQDVVEDLFWVGNVMANSEDRQLLLDAAIVKKGSVTARSRAFSHAMYDQMLVSTLNNATPYFIDAHVQDLIAASADSLPPSTILDKTYFPTLDGYARYQDTPRTMRPMAECGLMWSWGRMSIEALTGSRRPVRLGDEYIDPAHPVLTVIPLFAFVPPRLTHSIPIGSVVWPDGFTLERTARMYKRVVERQELTTIGDAAEADPYRVALALLRKAAALAIFMHQEIVVTTPVPTDRAARKRMAREAPDYKPRDCHIVRLRRIHHTSGTHESEHIDHAYRWWVSGHWRVLYRDTPAQRTVWVRPHVKGPDDKPLKQPGLRVFEVVR